MIRPAIAQNIDIFVLPTEAEKLSLDQFDTRFPASHSFISYLIACEAVQICASPTFLLSEGHSAFPGQRMALFRSRFQHAENLLLCPSGAKGTHFAGKFGDCWLLFADSKRRKTVWWTKSRANHSPPPNSVNKPILGPNWSNLPLPVMRTECVNERIGDLATPDLDKACRVSEL